MILQAARHMSSDLWPRFIPGAVFLVPLLLHAPGWNRWPKSIPLVESRGKRRRRLDVSQETAPQLIALSFAEDEEAATDQMDEQPFTLPMSRRDRIRVNQVLTDLNEHARHTDLTFRLGDHAAHDATTMR